MLTNLTIDVPSSPDFRPETKTDLVGRVAQLEDQLQRVKDEHYRFMQTVKGIFDTLNREGALQIADATIDGSAIGANSASTGKFTTLDASGLISANGGQVKFPATQNASADANTLDDYEEGTWNPTVTAGLGAFTTVSSTGAYTKIGRLVHVRVEIAITTNGTAAGNTRFTLPFTPAALTAFSGIEVDVTGFAAAGYFKTDGEGLLVKYDGSYLGGNSYRIEIEGSYYI